MKKLLDTIEDNHAQKHLQTKTKQRQTIQNESKQSGVLPRALNQQVLTKSPSGRTISFDVYVKKKLYKKENRQDHSPNLKLRHTQQEIEFPSSPEEIPRDS